MIASAVTRQGCSVGAPYSAYSTRQRAAGLHLRLGRQRGTQRTSGRHPAHLRYARLRHSPGINRMGNLGCTSGGDASCATGCATSGRKRQIAEQGRAKARAVAASTGHTSGPLRHGLRASNRAAQDALSSASPLAINRLRARCATVVPQVDHTGATPPPPQAVPR